ncbi:hypothetical protein [Streptomyces yaizuensis]|uniref:Sensor domain-containing protein n=1 Tax=Streptomyces yaizuensis TaxID=2989713 RepID=A0ABQ5PAM9_9ACTN|nr:hypothetical protein [Streptomyces sp. YSPA8]GLF99602.1 sensor domain-containing protein [Streptomyces sp. YSPA8]
MPRTAVRRTTVVAASLLSLALTLSACSEADSGKEDKGGAQKNAKEVPAAELAKLMLTKEDVPGHRFKQATAADLKQTAGEGAKDAKCAPIVDALTLRTGGKPSHEATQTITPEPKKPPKDASPEEQMKAALGGTTVQIGLVSLAGEGGADALAALEKAGQDCAGGFDLKGADATKVKTVEKDGFSAGDESVSLLLTSDLDEKTTMKTYVVAVRKGSVVATFAALSLAGETQHPKALVEKQLAKLG